MAGGTIFTVLEDQILERDYAPGEFQVEAHASAEAFQTLEAEWDRLAAAVGRSPSQTCAYAALAWRRVSQEAGVKLALISASHQGRLLAIWPLYLRTEGFCSVANHLGCGSNEEYAGPLIADDAEAPMIAEQLLAQAKGLADALRVYAVRPDHPMARALHADRSYRRHGLVRSPAIDAPLNQDWDSWLASRSKSFRSGLKYDRKRLSELLALGFVDVKDPAAIDRAVDWLFDVKAAALRENRHRKSWVYSRSNVEFFKEVVKTVPGVKVFSLMGNDEILCSSIVFQSENLMEFFMTSYNLSYSKYSPGNLLIEDIVRICFAEKLAFDFRITGDNYKMRWKDSDHPYENFLLATSIRGAAVVLNETRRRATVAFKIATKQRLKALMVRSRRQ
jgi:CelD/BcsL family acetyltransferase involved in cellulose biosynthesis